MIAQFMPPVDELPNWVPVYVFAVILASVFIGVVSEVRKHRADEKEGMRQHVNRTDTYLDPAGWQQ